MSTYELMQGTNCMQFTFWSSCNLGCDFCFYKYDDETLDISTKQNTINKILGWVRDKEFMINPVLNKPFSSVGFIGGELFDNQLEGVEEEWVELLNEINNNDNIKEIWLATSLVFVNRKWLELTIEKLNKKRLLINTSWDPIGRFKTDKIAKIWESNVQYLLDRKLHVTCTTVLSQRLIEYFYEKDLPKVLFKLSAYMFFRAAPIPNKKSTCSLPLTTKDNIRTMMATDYQPENFFIKNRDQFIKFCYDFIEKYGEGPLKYYINESSHSSSIVPLGGTVIYDRWHRDDTPCKHEYLAYQYLDDSNACLYCDVKSIVG